MEDESLGVSSFKDFEGESIESRLDREVVVVIGAVTLSVEEGIAIELVDCFRRLPKDIESRVFLRGSPVLERELGTVRGTREIDWGELRAAERTVGVL